MSVTYHNEISSNQSCFGILPCGVFCQIKNYQCIPKPLLLAQALPFHIIQQSLHWNRTRPGCEVPVSYLMASCIIDFEALRLNFIHYSRFLRCLKFYYLLL